MAIIIGQGNRRSSGGGGGSSDAGSQVIVSTGSWYVISQYGQLYTSKEDAVAAAGITEEQFDALLAGTMFAPMMITNLDGSKQTLPPYSYKAGTDILEADGSGEGYEVRKAVWTELNYGWSIGIESIFQEGGVPGEGLNGWYVFGTYYEDSQ